MEHGNYRDINVDVAEVEEAYRRKRKLQELGYKAIERLLVRPDPDEGWSEQALCLQVGYEIFMPKKGQSADDAKKICGRCKVRTECLEEALADKDTEGVCGGTTERERRTIRKQRKEASLKRGE